MPRWLAWTLGIVVALLAVGGVVYWMLTGSADRTKAKSEKSGKSKGGSDESLIEEAASAYQDYLDAVAGFLGLD